MSAVTVRPLVESDKTQWQPLWQAYLESCQARLNDAVTEATWSRLAARTQMHGFGAFDRSNRLIGFAHTVIHPNTWHIGECCYLEDLFVEVSGRNQGIARSLIENIYRFAEAQGLNRVYWTTGRNNLNAQFLYDKLARREDIVQYRKDFPAE